MNEHTHFETIARTLHSEYHFLNHAMTSRYIELCLESFRTPFQAMSDSLLLLRGENEKILAGIWRTNRSEWAAESYETTANFETVRRFSQELSKRLS